MILSIWACWVFEPIFWRLGPLKRSKYEHFIDSVILSKSYSTSGLVWKEIVTNLSKTLSEIDRFADSLFKHKIFRWLNPAINFRVTPLPIVVQYYLGGQQCWTRFVADQGYFLSSGIRICGYHFRKNLGFERKDTGFVRFSESSFVPAISRGKYWVWTYIFYWFRFFQIYLTFFKLNISCSDFQDCPGSIWNARIRCRFVPKNIWGCVR